MSSFNNFVQVELPKRPFTNDDGTDGQILVRSSNSEKPRELIWTDIDYVLDTYNKAQLDTLLDDKADSIHAHTESEILDLDKYTQLEINNLLDDKADISHVHVIDDITGLQDELSNKSNNNHTHIESEILDLDKYTQLEINNLLDDKADINHVHIIDDITGLQDVLNDKADIDHVHDLVNIVSTPTNTIYVDVNRTDEYTETGYINAPFKTIQDALDYLGQPISNSDFSRVCIINIAPGSYVEDLIVPCRPILLYGQGVIIDGNITQNIAADLKFGVSSSDYRPTLSISGHSLMDARTTHRSRVYGIEIRGNIQLQLESGFSGYQGTHHDIILSSVKVNGTLTDDNDTGGGIVYLNNFRIDGDVNGQNIEMYYLNNGRFGGDINVKSWLENIRIDFRGNIVLNNILSSNKWIDCSFVSGKILNVINAGLILNIDSLTSNNITDLTLSGETILFNLLDKASSIENTSNVDGITVNDALNTLNSELNVKADIYIQSNEPPIVNSNSIWIQI